MGSASSIPDGGSSREVVSIAYRDADGPTVSGHASMSLGDHGEVGNELR